jgi:hypothetical protein
VLGRVGLGCFAPASVVLLWVRFVSVRFCSFRFGCGRLICVKLDFIHKVRHVRLGYFRYVRLCYFRLL